MTHTNPEISLIPKSPAEVAKAILFIVVGVAAYLKDAISGGISPIEGEQLVVTFVTLIPVYFLTGTLVKTITVFVSAGLQALAVPVAALVGWSAWSQITLGDYLNAGLIAFAAIGIAVVPNKPMIDARDSNVVTSAQPVGSNGASVPLEAPSTVPPGTVARS